MKDERRWQTVRISAELAEKLESAILSCPRPRPTRSELLSEAWDIAQKAKAGSQFYGGMTGAGIKNILGASRDDLARIVDEMSKLLQQMSAEPRKRSAAKGKS